MLVLRRRGPMTLFGVQVRVTTAADLVLLKLYAGGPRDLFNVESLLSASPEPAVLIATVNERVEALPADARKAWSKFFEHDR